MAQEAEKICPLLPLAIAEDWRQFRGRNASGVVDDPRLPQSWGPEENVLWQVDIDGDAWSSPVMTGGKLFLTNAVADGPKGEDNRP